MGRSAGNAYGIIVRFIYSACIVTSTKDVSILHDPWFTEGIYDVSWFHYPDEWIGLQGETQRVFCADGHE